MDGGAAAAFLRRGGAGCLLIWAGVAVAALPAVGFDPGASPRRDGQRGATTPADRLRESVSKSLAAGEIEAALAAAQRALAAYPNDDEVREEFVSIHVSLARRAVADENFELADRALRAAYQVDRDDPETRRLLLLIRSARESVPGRLVEARGWLALEWFEPAFVAFRQATALAPARAAAWRADYLAAAIGAGDDNYVTKNFHDAFYYYDAALGIDDSMGRESSPSLMMRWAQCLTHALARDVDRAAYPPEFWKLVLRRAQAIQRREDDGSASGLRFVLRGLAYENLSDGRRAAGEYARYLDVNGVVSSDARGLRERAVRKLRKLYDVELCSRRLGTWNRVEAGDWGVVRTEGFRIHHHNEDVARRVAAAAGFHFARIADLFSLDVEEIPWREPCDIYIHATEREFRERTRQGAGVRGVSVIKSKGGRLVSHEIHLIQSDPLLLSASLSHEVAHLMVGAVRGYRPLPAVVSEGVALQIEPKCRRRQFARLFGDLKRPPRIDQLLGEARMHPPEAEFYAAAFRLAEVLRSKVGLRALVRMEDGKGSIQNADDLARRFGIAGAVELERLYAGSPLGAKSGAP